MFPQLGGDFDMELADRRNRAPAQVSIFPENRRLAEHGTIMDRQVPGLGIVQEFLKL